MGFLRRLLGIGRHQSREERQTGTREPAPTKRHPSTSAQAVIDPQSELKLLGMIDPQWELERDLEVMADRLVRRPRMLFDLRRKIEEQMGLLEFLCTCGRFDRARLATYFSMAEKVGMSWSEQEKQWMLNASSNVLPKRESDRRVLSGYEQVRVTLVEGLSIGVTEGIRLLKQLLADSPVDKSTTSSLEGFLALAPKRIAQLTRTWQAIMAQADSDARQAILDARSADEDVRAEAILALGRTGGAESVSVLLALLDDTAGRVRALAAESLGRVGVASCVPELVALLSDSEGYVVAAAARALARLGDESALGPLQELENHGNPEIAAACRKAAARLRGAAER